jgi:hypothetical protein
MPKTISTCKLSYAQNIMSRMSFQEPKDLFPKMPADVFDQWIAPLIPVYGWPFSSIDCSTENTKWCRFFAGRSLAQWAQFDFRLEELAYGVLKFEETTQWRIEGIIDHCTLGLPSKQANIHDTVNRFAACANFIRRHGCLPRAIIGIPHMGSLEIIDGHHRLAALIYVGVPAEFKISIWIVN